MIAHPSVHGYRCLIVYSRKLQSLLFEYFLLIYGVSRFHIKHPSLMLECRSLIPTRTRRWLARDGLAGFSLVFKLSTLGDPARKLLVGIGLDEFMRSRAYTSTIHSYQTLRSSVWRYIVATISPFSGTLRGVWRQELVRVVNSGEEE